MEIKREHERKFLKSDFKLDEAELYKLSFEMQKYWSDIDRLNKLEHIFADSGLAMDVKGDSSFSEVFTSVHDAVNCIESFLKLFHKSDEALKSDFEALLIKKGIPPSLYDDIPYYEHPFKNRNWELHNIGSTNWLQRLRIDLVHIEVKYLEEYLKTHGDDSQAKVNFEKAKEELKQYAKTAMHAD